jgi:NADH-quinone oxidoreductase subunit L
LLFLGAGSVIHALSDEQDMGKMGGIWKRIPYTYAIMWIGTLALTGFPFLSGYYSKDLILESAFLSHSPVGQWVFWVGILSAFLTALYSWRLMFLVFHGSSRCDERVMARIHESPPVLLVPLGILALGALGVGGVTEGLFTSPKFWQGLFPLLNEGLHHPPPLWVVTLPVGVSVLGFAVAWALYIRFPSLAPTMARKWAALYRFLYHKWYIDELYHLLIVVPLWRLGQILWRKGDQGIIDPLIPDGTAHMVRYSARFLSRFQSGYVFQYAVVMLVGVIGMTLWQLTHTLLTQ